MHSHGYKLSFFWGPYRFNGLVHFLNIAGPSLTKVVYAYFDRISYAFIIFHSFQLFRAFSLTARLPILPGPLESLVLGVGLRRPHAIEGLLNFRQLLRNRRVVWGQDGSGCWAVSCCSWGPVLNAPRRPSTD